MAAPDLTLSRGGQINADSGTWDKDNALWLKVFSGEVLTAFKRQCILAIWFKQEPFLQVAQLSSR